MSRLTYAQTVDGQSFYVPMAHAGGWFMRCCDCRLVHRIDLRLVSDGAGRKLLKVTAYRDERKTAASRREQRKR